MVYRSWAARQRRARLARRQKIVNGVVGLVGVVVGGVVGVLVALWIVSETMPDHSVF